MANDNITKTYRGRVGLEDLTVGFGVETQTRNGQAVSVTQINASNLPFSETETLLEAINRTESYSIDASSSASGASLSASQASGYSTSASLSASQASGYSASASLSASQASGSAVIADSAKVYLNGVYLGASNTEPTLNLNGEALSGGELYLDTSDIDPNNHLMKVYILGTGWVAAYASLGGALINSNNLSDVSSASGSRINLGLGNVENTSDLNKPISTATLDAIANIPETTSVSYTLKGDCSISSGTLYGNNLLVSIASGSTTAIKNTVIVKNGAINPMGGYADGINYVKMFADGSSEATLTKPSWGMYFATMIDEDRPIYTNGLWSSTIMTELVTNGTFDTDISGWVASNANITLSWSSSDSSLIMADLNGDVSSKAETIISVIAGQKLTIKFDIVASDAIAGIYFYMDGILIGGTGANIVGTHTFNYTPTVSGNIVFALSHGTSANRTSRIDNVSIFGTTSGTAYSPQFTYLNNEKGKLLGVEVVGGVPVALHYMEGAPKIVESVAKFDKVIAEVEGKNSCTAWVNFDGTTTPPTIRDSFNVSDVVRTTTGNYDVYFNESMDTTNYVGAASAGASSNDPSDRNVACYPTSTTYCKLEVYATATIQVDTEVASLIIMGGKN